MDKQTAMRWEDLYIYGYKKEGLWGMGKPPASQTPIEHYRAGQSQMERKAKFLRTQKIMIGYIEDGYTSAGAISRVSGMTDGYIRKHLAELQRTKVIELKETTPWGAKIWKMK